MSEARRTFWETTVMPLARQMMTLPERTGVHHCIRCLRDVPAEEYYANDFLCNGCVECEHPLGNIKD